MHRAQSAALLSMAPLCRCHLRNNRNAHRSGPSLHQPLPLPLYFLLPKTAVLLYGLPCRVKEQKLVASRKWKSERTQFPKRTHGVLWAIYNIFLQFYFHPNWSNCKYMIVLLRLFTLISWLSKRAFKRKLRKQESLLTSEAKFTKKKREREKQPGKLGQTERASVQQLVISQSLVGLLPAIKEDLWATWQTAQSGGLCIQRRPEEEGQPDIF